MVPATSSSSTESSLADWRRTAARSILVHLHVILQRWSHARFCDYCADTWYYSYGVTLLIISSIKHLRFHSCSRDKCSKSEQGRPVNVKHDARCVMGKVGWKTKDPKGGIFIYCYKSIAYQLCDYKMHQNPHTTICTICYLLSSRGHRSLLWVYDSQTHSSRSSDLSPQDNNR